MVEWIGQSGSSGVTGAPEPDAANKAGLSKTSVGVRPVRHQRCNDAQFRLRDFHPSRMEGDVDRVKDDHARTDGVLCTITLAPQVSFGGPDFAKANAPTAGMCVEE